MLTVEQLLTDARRALSAEGLGDLSDDMESALVSGQPNPSIDVACKSVRTVFPDRGDAVARAIRGRAGHQALLQLETAFLDPNRRRSAVESPPNLSLAYVRLVFAYGFARSLDVAGARERMEATRQALNLRDSLHGALFGQFATRVRTALGEEHVLQQVELERFVRYKFERARQLSVILEPLPTINAAEWFQTGNETAARFEPPPALAAQLSGERRPTRFPERIASIARDVDDGVYGAGMERLSNIRNLGDVARRIGSSACIDLVRQLTPRVATTSDSFNTNSHFCAALLTLADAFVLTLIGEPTLRENDWSAPD